MIAFAATLTFLATTVTAASTRSKSRSTRVRFTSYATPYNLVAGAGLQPPWEMVLSTNAKTADECEALCANATTKTCNSYTWYV
jgi:hypothetical protein